MPYRRRDDLPKGVRDHLPQRAQTIYMKAFNAAYKTYADSDKRQDNAFRDETAARVAWSAVKKKYRKNRDGKWVRRLHRALF